MAEAAALAVGAMSAPKVTWVSVDDWNAVYVDGVLMGEQNHSVSPWTWEEVLKALGAKLDDQRDTEIANRLAEEMGRFPESWPPPDDDL